MPGGSGRILITAWSRGRACGRCSSGRCLRWERLAQRSEGKTIAAGGHGTAISVLLHSFSKGGFGYSDFCRIREKTPWVVRLTFAGSECVAVEEVWEEG